MTTGHQCGQRKTAANMAPALASVLQNAQADARILPRVVIICRPR